ncbi:MAG: hypothetical protein LBJ67_05330 [Planctomycetaceae bacterium]|nr:hypothetical protein [Planctomycetaceae bacterium]
MLILLPYDYPETWLNWYFNEQYLLCCYLLGGMGGDTIEFPVNFIWRKNDAQNILKEIKNTEKSPLSNETIFGGAFWMRKA